MGRVVEVDSFFNSIINVNQNGKNKKICRNGKIRKNTKITDFIEKEISPDFQKSGDDTERISIELSKSDEMEKRQQMIMEIMKENPSISAKDIALKMNITRGQVEKSISDMKKTGKIQRSGSARNGQWHIL